MYNKKSERCNLRWTLIGKADGNRRGWSMFQKSNWGERSNLQWSEQSGCNDEVEILEF